MTLPSSICVYCASAIDVAQSYRDAAAELGRTLGSQGVDIVYGGGRNGLMGLVADAALAEGGRVIGIIPQSIAALEVGHLSLSELVTVETMHQRKLMMAERAGAFVVLPGGLGTLDEALEMLAWKQLGLHDKPIVILNVAGYWDPLLAMLARAVDEHFIYERQRALYRAVSEVAEVLPAIAADL